MLSKLKLQRILRSQVHPSVFSKFSFFSKEVKVDVKITEKVTLHMPAGPGHKGDLVVHCGKVSIATNFLKRFFLIFLQNLLFSSFKYGNRIFELPVCVYQITVQDLKFFAVKKCFQKDCMAQIIEHATVVMDVKVPVDGNDEYHLMPDAVVVLKVKDFVLTADHKSCLHFLKIVNRNFQEPFSTFDGFFYSLLFFF